MLIQFLSAHKPLTKTFALGDKGEIIKHSYPDVARFTSHDELVETPLDFFKVLKAHASKGHCLLKGTLLHSLNNEYRKGLTQAGSPTQWICLDFDRYVTPDLPTALAKLGINQADSIVQWSSSHGTAGTEGTISCHVFVLLEEAVPAPVLKLWLQELNFVHFPDQIGLTRENAALRWPLDISVCQNDKLIYVAPPIFLNNLVDSVSTRIEFVKGKQRTLPISALVYKSPEITRKERFDKRAELRAAAGLPLMRKATKWVGDTEVQPSPGEAMITGLLDCSEYVRMNINGGDSFAYWHFKDNFELIRSFKSDLAFYTKELLPQYYTDLCTARDNLANTPNDQGDLVLAFRDFYSDWYYNGTWNRDREELILSRTKSETRLEHWLMSHARPIPSFFPIWTMAYNPRADYIVDEDRHRINTYAASTYRRNARVREVSFKEECPTIHKIMWNLIGSDADVELSFTHWLALIFQNLAKPRVSWTFHGIEGTGKGLFINDVLVPLFGKNNMALKRASQLNDQFNGWLEQTQIVFVDEVAVEDFKEKGAITANLRNYITEPTLSVRKMQTQSYEVPSYCGFIFSSNRPQPVYIPPTDRRYNLGRFQQNKLPMTDHERWTLIPQELQAFADYIMSVTVNTELANAICHTPDRDRIQKLAITSVEAAASAIINGDLDRLWDRMPDDDILNASNINSPAASNAVAYSILMKAIARSILNKEKTYDRLSIAELQIIFMRVSGMDSAVGRFDKFLEHVNITLTRMRRGKKRFQGILVTWNVNDELLAYFDELFSEVPPRKLKAVK